MIYAKIVGKFSIRESDEKKVIQTLITSLRWSGIICTFEIRNTIYSLRSTHSTTVPHPYEFRNQLVNGFKRSKTDIPEGNNGRIITKTTVILIILFQT